MPHSQPLSFSADAIVDTVREPMLVLSADLRVRRANRSFYRTFRVTPEETVDRLVYDLGNQQWDIPWLRKLLEEVLPQDSAFDDFEVEHDFPAIGRKYMLLNARRICGKDNQTEFILLAIEDTTERRLAEEARREIESRYTSLVQNIKDHSIFMMDPDGIITTWNVEAEKIIGYQEAEILGRNFSVIFTEEDLRAGKPKEELRLAREDGRAEDERWHVRKDGSRFWALGIVTPMHDAGGKLTGFSKILRDMTDRKRAEEALQDADRRKDVFLATLAHELRNPLAPIRNAVQILRQQGPPAPEAEWARGVIDRQMQLMTTLIDDLLDISRIALGKLELRTERVALATVVLGAVETSRPLIDRLGHELVISLPPDPIPLEADLTRLAQVFVNLLNNAAKYSERGGRIRLTAERQGSDAVVSITDTGIGIPADKLPHVFEMYTQVDRALDRSEGGLGIGLALVRQLVAMHGGSIEARSDGPGRGSEFVVRLPIDLSAQLKRQRGPDPEQAATPSGLRILVVDDNRDAADSLSVLLRFMGNEPRTAYDGIEAVVAAGEFRPDVVLLDIGLPRLNGYGAAQRIREQPWGKDMVLIALTGWGQEDDRKRSKEAGFDNHMVKPVELPSLMNLLAGLQRLRV
jgi:PAS domain S-box-containing protein